MGSEVAGERWLNLRCRCPAPLRMEYRVILFFVKN